MNGLGRGNHANDHEDGDGPVEGVAVRVARRPLALAAAIRHNFRTGRAVSRSLTAYAH
ncbi:hypothetical protein ABZZ80_27150 [Streptomyces sp. NPDC006356]